MTADAQQRWIAAGKALALDPHESVRCPVRDDGQLVVHDQPHASDPTRFERYLTCEVCGARNVLLMRRPAR